MPLDVLDHDDGIVNHQTGGKNDSEQCQRINRKSEQFDESKRANQRNRNRDRRNERGPPVLQEEEHHQHHKQDCLDQRSQHLANGIADERRGVESNVIFEPWRKALRQPRQFDPHGLVHVQGIGRRQLAHADSDCLESAVPQLSAVIFGAQFGPPNIFHANQRSVAPGFENDVLKLRGLAQPADSPHADLEHLVLRRRLLSHLARGDLDVLLRQRRNHIRRRQSPCRQTRRIKPQAHGVLALAEDDDVGHTMDALQRILHVNVEVIADKPGE